MSWLHACWGVGAAGARWLTASLLASGASWRTAYLTLGGIELLLAAAFALTRALWRG